MFQHVLMEMKDTEINITYTNYSRLSMIIIFLLAFHLTKDRLFILR